MLPWIVLTAKDQKSYSKKSNNMAMRMAGKWDMAARDEQGTARSAPGTDAQTGAIARFDASLDQFMRYFLVHINPVLHRATYKGRSYSEYEIITVMALGLVGPARPVDLSRGLAIEKGSLTSILRRLTALALIEKRAIPGDERSYLVALTRAGLAFRRHVETQRRRAFKTLFANMDASELAEAAHGLDLLSAYLQAREHQHVRPSKNAAAGA